MKIGALVTIRKYETADIPELAQIYLDARENTFSWMPQGSFKISDFFKDTLGEEIYVILDKNLIVGFISIWAADNFIHHLYVKSDYQNKGYGKKLLEYGLKNTGRPAALKCVARNEKAVRFYKSKGWVIKEAGKDIMGIYYFMVFN